jgi:hydroxymethylglutaryl-CoA reductase (NADPH)
VSFSQGVLVAVHSNKIQGLLKRFMSGASLDKLKVQLAPKFHDAPARLRHLPALTSDLLRSNWRTLRKNTPLTEADEVVMCDTDSVSNIAAYSKNIENCVGMLKVPVGVAGPLRINGLFANGDYYVPLATTEAALVASYARGAALITQAGGCTSLLLNDIMTRAPGFVFETLIDAVQFVMWLNEQYETLKRIADSTSRFGRLQDMRVTMEGNHVYVNFDYVTGNASGQNMVTIATAAIMAHVKAHSPITPKQAFIEANLSGDKKASSLSFLSARGKKVTVEVTIGAEAVRKTLHCEAALIVDYCRLAALGGVMSGTMGVQGHFANGLAAFYLATGQDVACVSESSIGITRLELKDNGDLYACVTMPNIIVGTVGGGTGLPSQHVGLKMMGLEGEHSALALAEVCASICLAGELSIMGALCAGEFASAHTRLARGKAAK